MLILIQNVKHESIQVVHIQRWYFSENWFEQIVLLV